MYSTTLSDCFFKVCLNGHISVAEWLLQTNPRKINSYHFGLECNNMVLKYVCGAGQVKMAQWMLSVKPSLDIRWAGSVAFPEACLYGHLEMVKWLTQILRAAGEKVPSVGHNFSLCPAEIQVFLRN